MLPPVVVPPFNEQDARRLGPLREWFWRHPVATDWIVAVAFAAPCLLVAAPTTGAPALLVPLVVAGAFALLARRRAPLVVLAAFTVLAVSAVVLTGSLSGFDLGVALAVYAVAADRRTSVTWVSLAASASVVTGAVFISTGANGAGELPGLALLMFAALAIGTNVRNRRLHVRDLVERGNALAREAEQTAQLATAEERARIAREMHDVVAHSLSVMIALADGAAASIDASPASARAAVDAVSSTGRAALADMRRVLGVLRDGDAAFGPAPGGTELDELVQSFRSAGLPVDLAISGPPLPQDTGLQLAVYRIVQESLTNALRHTGGGGRVTATIAYDAGTVSIGVADDGGLARSVSASSPAGVSTGGGRGVIGMRERAAIYDGTVAAGPQGAGWRVDAVLRWDEEES